MRLWNGLTPHSIVMFDGKMYRIKELYEKNGNKFADLISGENIELKEIDIINLKKVDD